MSKARFSLMCLIVILNQMSRGLKVCDELEYYNHPNDDHCYEEKDSGRNISEVVRNWGFTAEDYPIYTEDGYEILVVRAYSQITQKTPILFGHGITTNSIMFVLRQNRSYVHYMCSKGFDVWMVNFRGSKYSKKHRFLSSTQKEFWSFSFSEMAQYDLPAALELVTHVTGRKVLYVGFSMGTTVSYVFSSLYPNKAESYLEGIVSLASIAYMKPIKSAIKLFAPLYPGLRKFIYEVFHGELALDDPLLFQLCGRYPWQFLFCQKIRNFVFGHNFQEFDPAYQPLISKVLMDNAGVEVLSHFSQLILSGRFEAQDFGRDINLKRYGSSNPPSYNLSRIPVPVSILYAENDFVATEMNAKRTYSELNPRSRCGIDNVKSTGFNHGDFVEARHITTLVLEPLYKKIMKILNQKCHTP